MRKVLCLFFMCCLLTTALPAIGHADSLEDYRAKTCEPGEKEVVAHYTIDAQSGTRVYDETSRYTNDSRYYELGNFRDASRGEVTYCQIKVNETLNLISVIAIMTGALMGLLFTRSQDAH